MGASRINFGTVVSSRVDLAREISGSVYMCQLKTQEAVDAFNANFEKILDKVNKDIEQDGLQAQCKDVITCTNSDDDDIHIVATTPALSLQQGYYEAMLVDEYFQHQVTWAYDENIGHLTSIIENMGMGVKLTVRVNLMNIFRANKISGVQSMLDRIGLLFTESYPKASDPDYPAGCFFDITAVCAFKSDINKAIENLEDICVHLDETEGKLLAAIMKRNSDTVKNSIFRAYSVCNNSLLISLREAIDIASDMRVAIMLGVVEGTNYEGIYSLLDAVQHEKLQKEIDRQMKDIFGDKARDKSYDDFIPIDKLRAMVIQKTFKSIKLLMSADFEKIANDAEDTLDATQTA